ncbi:inositol monophosphatase [Marivita sp. S6314]|uniref:inositol monophosphatase family protein n=1 Tax=Marivita sp. S6314 TaxID=2926406 RepID=UPI001FF2D239|nr:inositol monophosphatase family protein [Marivita sp. S6314]MCK0150680.1 inositol monophosphatase [Marivita sp. S6314]
MTDLQTRLEAAQRIARDAASVAMAHFRQPLDVTAKSDDSPVTIADQATERAIRSALGTAFPGETIFGEEFGQSGSHEDMWIVDPIDGTRSFITGLPLFGMLLGYVSGDGPQVGVINMPALNELYAGARGLGATLNGQRVSVSGCTSLSEARLFLNEADKMAVETPDIFARLVTAGGLRRLGADCYPHALVASGHADAVVDYGLQPYDYLPVAAVVEAAGGVMTDWQGNTLTLQSDGRTLTAATPDLHAELLELVHT